MIRTQIQVTDAQAAKLRRLAAEQGVSIAEVMRDAVDRLPEPGEGSDRLSRAIAAGRRGFADREGRSDVSRRHDDYLPDAFDR